MLCPQCGTSVGDRIQLCTPCGERAAAAEQARLETEAEAKTTKKAPAPKPTQDNAGEAEAAPPISKFLARVILAFAAAMILFVILLVLHPRHSALEALILSVMLVEAGIGLIFWALMWAHLLMGNTLIALLSLVFPIGVYMLVLQDPEFAKRPAIISVQAFFVVAFLWLGFSALTDRDPMEQLDEMFGGDKALTSQEKMNNYLRERGIQSSPWDY